jgi:hypothetical protein
VAEPSRSNPNQCAGIRADGQPCTSTAVGASGYCFAHDPDRAAERDDARRRGGENRSNSARLRGLVPPRLLATFDALEDAMAEVHDGRLDPRQANAMASLARAMVAVLQAGELEERVRQLEARSAA